MSHGLLAVLLLAAVVAPGEEPLMRIGDATMTWPATGSLAFTFTLAEAVRPDGSDHPAIPLVDLPGLRCRIERSARSVNLVLLTERADGGTVRAVANGAWLAADRPYHLAIVWDLAHPEPWQRLRLILDGVPLGDLFHWNNGDWTARGLGPGPARFAGMADGVRIDAARRDDPRPPAGTVPVEGAFHAVAPPDIDLVGLVREPFFRADFSAPLDVEAEAAAVRDGRRVRTAERPWVLEGPGRAETVDGALRLTPADPADPRGLVLWLDRELPADVAIDYELRPRDPRCGLHIAFFATRAADGGSIFAPGLPERDGRFQSYIIGGLSGYHVSGWATDDRKPRRTANLRKNDGFRLVACGLDRIAEAPAGVHRLTLIQLGGRIRLLVDGQPALAWDDDGIAHGPVRRGGWFGLRFMAHTGWAEVRDLRIDRLRAAP